MLQPRVRWSGQAGITALGRVPATPSLRPHLAKGGSETCAAPAGLITRNDVYPAFRARRWRVTCPERSRSVLGYPVSSRGAGLRR